jgi:hypothetical protein
MSTAMLHSSHADRVLIAAPGGPGIGSDHLSLDFLRSSARCACHVHFVSQLAQPPAHPGECMPVSSAIPRRGIPRTPLTLGYRNSPIPVPESEPKVFWISCAGGIRWMRFKNGGQSREISPQWNTSAGGRVALAFAFLSFVSGSR